MSTWKDTLIKQGYVPPTCLLAEPFAGQVIFSEVAAGRDPCTGCNEDRTKCKGRPKEPK